MQYCLVDHMLVAKWVRAHYGVRSGVTAVFMLHSVLNGSPVVSVPVRGFQHNLSFPQVMQPYLNYGETWVQDNRVPITLKYFKLLARLGRAPVCPYMRQELRVFQLTVCLAASTL
jgi:hypothetical protein